MFLRQSVSIICWFTGSTAQCAQLLQLIIMKFLEKENFRGRNFHKLLFDCENFCLMEISWYTTPPTWSVPQKCAILKPHSPLLVSIPMCIYMPSLHLIWLNLPDFPPPPICLIQLTTEATIGLGTTKWVSHKADMCMLVEKVLLWASIALTCL